MISTSIDNDMLLQILNLIVTIPSLIGCLMMGYVCYKNISITTCTKLLLALAISDFLYSISNVMSLISIFDSDENRLSCKVEGFLRDFFQKFSICLVTSMAILHYKILIANERSQNSRTVTICIVVGLVIASIFALW